MTTKWIKKRRSRVIRTVVFVIALAVFLISAWQLLSIFLEYKRGSDEYDSLASQAEQLLETAQAENPGETQAAEERPSTGPWTQFHNTMLAQNEDYVGWIIIEDTKINYPIVQFSDNSWYLNNSDSSQMQWRDFFHKELYPLMQEKYDIRPESTFITGLSMGGHGAVNIFIDNPDKFRACGSMSGVLNLQLTSLKDKEVKKIVGDKTERYDSESAVVRIASVAEKLKKENKPIIVTCGYGDVYSICSEEFSDKCRELSVPHILMLSPGVHSWTYWGFALEEHLFLFSKILKGENLGY